MIMSKLILVLGIIILVGSLLLLLVSPLALLFTAFGIFLIIMSEKKQKAESTPKKQTPTKRYIEYTVYPVDQVNADKFFSFYKQDLDENEEYDWSNKELLEDSYDDKVYRYDPFKLNYKVEDGNVYAEMDGEYILTGRLKKTDLDRIDGGNYFLYPNIYKKINDESVVKESGDHYFGFYIKKEADN